MVQSYYDNLVAKRVTPLETKKTKYSDKSSAYSTLLNSLSSLKSAAAKLNLTDSDSIFKSKTASSTNSTFVTASATTSALSGSYELRVSQLAKKDIVMSVNKASGTVVGLTGTHTFQIISGDGEGGQNTSKISVSFDGDETYEETIKAIQNAINADKAVVSSTNFTGTDAYTGGATSFTFDIGGTETTVELDGSAATYSQLMDQIASAVNNKVDGVEAVKVADANDPTKFHLEFTVTDSSKYISISHESGDNVVSALGFGVTKEIGASGAVSASSFSPSTGNTQLSLTAKNSGLDYRIISLTDDSGSEALNSVGLNLGSTRAEYSQTANTAGYIYTDITTDGNQLNSKFTFNGLSMQRNSNSVSDIATGVTFSLKGVMDADDTTVSVTVESDTSAVVGYIQDFITAFNEVYSYLKSNSTYTDGIKGKLYADSTTQALISNFQSIMTSTVSGLKLDSLADIGISFSSTDGLSVSDSSKLTDKIKENASGVAELFNSGNGLTTKLVSYIKSYLGSGGYINTQISSIDSYISSLNDRIESVKETIDKSTEKLRLRYQNLQSLYASLVLSSSTITSTLSS
jgi:flagellar hook-associated protein 2